MTARNQPHLLRCETCKNPDCPVWLSDNAKLAQRGKIREDHHILTILSKCGCASHSDAGKAEQKPCLSCKIPKQNKDGSCCLDEKSCMDIAKWERNTNAEQRIEDVIVELENSIKTGSEIRLDKLIKKLRGELV